MLKTSVFLLAGAAIFMTTRYWDRTAKHEECLINLDLHMQKLNVSEQKALDEVSVFREKMEEAQRSINLVKIDKEKAEADAITAKDKSSSLQAQVDLLLEENSSKDSEIETLKANIKEVAKSGDSCKEDKKEWDTLKTKLEKQIATLKTELADSQAEVAVKEKEEAEAKDKAAAKDVKEEIKPSDEADE